MIVASILHLLETRRPVAIARFIIAAVVLAVDAVVFRWTRPHVGEERLEGLSPPCAHNYAASSVVFVCTMSHAFAPLNNCGPNPILRSVKAVDAVSVCPTSVSDRDAADASAVRGIAAFKMVAACLKHVATTTPTPPQVADLLCGAVLSSKSKHLNAAKCLIGNVDEPFAGGQRNAGWALSFHGPYCSTPESDIKG